MKKFFLITVIFVFALTSCSLLGNKTPDSLAAAVEATLAVKNGIATAVAETAMSVPAVALATEAPTMAPPTETLPPMPTVTPTEVPVVKIITTVNANCRYGPDKIFALVELLNAGTSATVIGQNTANGQWWKVRTASGKECWVFGDSVSVSGDTSIIAMLVSPPTPTAVPPPSWAGNWVIWFSTGPGNPETNAKQYNVAFTQTGQSLRGTIVASWTTMTIYGTVSNDGMTVSGDLDSSVHPDNFKFRLVRDPNNRSQFRGNFYYQTPGNDGVFCGYNNSAGFPSPCRP